jgi:HK97 family phage prohead protease
MTVEQRVGPHGYSHGWVFHGVEAHHDHSERADIISDNALNRGDASQEALQGHREAAKAHRAAARNAGTSAGHEYHSKMAALHSKVANGRKENRDAEDESDRLRAQHFGGSQGSRSYRRRGAAMVAEFRAQMTSASVNDLPDSAFAYIEPGGSKDSSGKTVPRSLRHFPVHDAAHTRNALARAPQSPFGEKAMPKIRAAAKKFGIHMSDSDSGRAVSVTGLEVERRFTPGGCELRAAVDGPRIGGYGAVFGKLSRNLGGFVEVVGNGAFNQSRSLDWPNVVCRFNHDSNMILGTTAGRTLTLRTDNVGLDYDVLPPSARADITELVERGDIQFSSFAFRVPPGGDEWGVTDQSYPMRTLHEVQLVDVAPVLDPAYPDATAGLRSLALAMDADLDEVRSMALQDELRRFFTRTDRSSVPVKPKITGMQAMMQLMEKKFPQV